MTPWWTEHWAASWGMALFQTVFWTLMVVGLPISRAPRRAGKARPSQLARVVAAMGCGVALGAALLVAGAVARSGGQPGFVWSRLLLWGAVMAVIDGVMLVAVLAWRPWRVQLQGGRP